MSNFLDGLPARLSEEIQRIGPSQLAKQTGVARATLYNWMERGNTPLDKLPLLQSAGVNVWYVLTGQPTPAAGAGGTTIHVTAHEGGFAAGGDMTVHPPQPPKRRGRPAAVK